MQKNFFVAQNRKYLQINIKVHPYWSLFLISESSVTSATDGTLSYGILSNKTLALFVVTM